MAKVKTRKSKGAMKRKFYSFLIHVLVLVSLIGIGACIGNYAGPAWTFKFALAILVAKVVTIALNNLLGDKREFCDFIMVAIIGGLIGTLKVIPLKTIIVILLVAILALTLLIYMHNMNQKKGKREFSEEDFNLQ